MRRVAALVALVALSLPVAAPAAVAEPAPEVVVLAAEAEELGPEPAPRDAEQNPARELAGYEDREVPFTWGAAWLLMFAGTVGLVLMLGLYHLLVRRPQQQQALHEQQEQARH